VFTLQTLPDLGQDKPFGFAVSEAAGFSLHAGVATRAHERERVRKSQDTHVLKLTVACFWHVKKLKPQDQVSVGQFDLKLCRKSKAMWVSRF